MEMISNQMRSTRLYIDGASWDMDEVNNFVIEADLDQGIRNIFMSILGNIVV